ncbi:MAG: RNA polymerase sigma factor [Bacillota bacterium]
MNDLEHLLIEKSKKGDIESFERLIEQYQKLAFNIAYRMLGDMEDAKDATQDALVKVYKSISSFNEQSSFSTWLYKIVTNTCLDELRKKKKNKTTSLDNPMEAEDSTFQRNVPDESSTTEEIVEKREEAKALYKAISLLPEQHKVVIILRDIKGLSYEQIGEILDCPEGTVKSRISRARIALRDILTNRMELSQNRHVKIEKGGIL